MRPRDAARVVPVGGEAVALLTPSHRADLERCALLFETIDRHVLRRGPHYVIVHDEDVPAFAPFASASRIVLPASRFLPRWLIRLPGLRWRKRAYWLSLRSRPVSGWHTQQIVKIAAASTLPHPRFCIVDSDNAFFRDFDVSRLGPARPAPLLVHPGDVDATRPRHVLWARTAHRVLGLPAPGARGDDYIDQIIVWEQRTVRAMTARIEQVTGRSWASALCRARDFSEYILYGSFVADDPEARARHAPTLRSFCTTHWDKRALTEEELLAMLLAATDPEVALCVQGFGDTPVPVIRSALLRHEALLDRAPMRAAAHA